MIISTKLDTFKGFDSSFTTLPMFTVYKKPLDFSNQYVARLFDLDKATPYFVCAETEEEVIEKLPDGLRRMERNEQDDAVIVCVYL